MPKQDTPQQNENLGGDLRKQIAALAGVALVDRSRYYTVTKGETVIAWVTPQRRQQRVDFPAADGKSVVASKSIVVADPAKIAPAVAKIAAAAKKVK